MRLTQDGAGSRYLYSQNFAYQLRGPAFSQNVNFVSTSIDHPSSGPAAYVQAGKRYRNDSHGIGVSVDCKALTQMAITVERAPATSTAGRTDR